LAPVVILVDTFLDEVSLYAHLSFMPNPPTLEETLAPSSSTLGERHLR
jgi:hypothetical protein